MAVAQRLHRRLDDEVGRAEIGLADAEVDDVAALGGKLRCAREHRERIFLADAIEGGDGFQHGSPPAFVGGGSSAQQPAKCKRSGLPLLARRTTKKWSPGSGPGLLSGNTAQTAESVSSPGPN